ncbi:hypothetical protein Mapa_014974 [Marchantia paleacea]|nr:hypothetical protein Mapa_014974 [Marchantia paleacea]
MRCPGSCRVPVPVCRHDAVRQVSDDAFFASRTTYHVRPIRYLSCHATYRASEPLVPLVISKPHRFGPSVGLGKGNLRRPVLGRRSAWRKKIPGETRVGQESQRAKAAWRFTRLESRPVYEVRVDYAECSVMISTRGHGLKLMESMKKVTDSLRTWGCSAPLHSIASLPFPCFHKTCSPPLLRHCDDYICNPNYGSALGPFGITRAQPVAFLSCQENFPTHSRSHHS